MVVVPTVLVLVKEGDHDLDPTIDVVVEVAAVIVVIGPIVRIDVIRIVVMIDEQTNVEVIEVVIVMGIEIEIVVMLVITRTVETVDPICSLPRSNGNVQLLHPS